MISKSKWLNLAVRGRRILYPRLAIPNKSASSFRDATGATPSEAEKSSNIQVSTPQVIPQRDSKYAEGKVYHGFKCERIEYVSDFELTSYTLRHEGTGTELWHIHRNDPNNVFSINFRTTPFDSTGLPHILEHLALCGSKNYPVRDPFFKMLNRSVATFMNAMTGPDYTLYPFSTMNEVDFRNLQRIYLDAVFRWATNTLAIQISNVLFIGLILSIWISCKKDGG